MEALQLAEPPTPQERDAIARRDGGRLLRDWRHFQAIKNQLVGAECEGVELYPAESRKVDRGNEYHIFCVRRAGWSLSLRLERGDRRSLPIGIEGFAARSERPKPFSAWC